MTAFLHETVPHEEQEVAVKEGWVLKELKPWHELVCSLLAQGMSMKDIAAIADCTPNYVSMLSRQDVIRKHVMDIAAFAGLQLEAQFAKSVDAIGEALITGNNKEKLMAARLQMEATGRVGSRKGDVEKVIDTNARLARLAEKLLYLQGGSKPSDIIEGEVIREEASDEGIEECQRAERIGNEVRPHQSAQDAGDGLSDSAG